MSPLMILNQIPQHVDHLRVSRKVQSDGLYDCHLRFIGPGIDSLMALPNATLERLQEELERQDDLYRLANDNKALPIYFE